MAVVGGLVHSTTLNLFWNFPGRIQDTFGKCFPPFSPVGGSSCREALRDDTEKMFWVLTRLRFTLGPVSLWYIRRGICLICPAGEECEGCVPWMCVVLLFNTVIFFSFFLFFFFGGDLFLLLLPSVIRMRT